jgi:hypothetical protein
MWQFEDFLFDDRIFFVMCGFAICRPIIFCGLKTCANPQINIKSLKCSHSNLRMLFLAFGTVLIHMTFRSLKYLYEGKNLWICDLRINHYQFADLRFVDWHRFDLRSEQKYLRAHFCGTILNDDNTVVGPVLTL